jgi:hypothetical protein
MNSDKSRQKFHGLENIVRLRAFESLREHRRRRWGVATAIKQHDSSVCETPSPVRAATTSALCQGALAVMSL